MDSGCYWRRGLKKVDDINDWTGYERDGTRTDMTQTLRLDDALTDHSWNRHMPRIRTKVGVNIYHRTCHS